MAQIEVHDKFTHDLSELAAQEHRAVAEIVDEAIASYLVTRFHEPSFSAAEIDRLKLGIDQLNRGEGISRNQVTGKFAAWRDRRASR